MRCHAFLKNRVIVEDDHRDPSPQVSIVMPTYCRNGEGLLTQCIDSVRAQTVARFEFIIVDDGSVDGTEAVVRDYAARDPRIVYVRHEENSGLPAVRTNEGILLARAPYVAFIFDDNIWVPDALETLLRAIDEAGVDLVYADTEMMRENDDPFVLGNWPLTRELLQHINTIPNGATLCRREMFDRYGLYDPHLILRRVCDWDLWLRVLRLGGRLAHVDKMLGKEYGTASSVSIGHTVRLDYKVTYAYIACEEQLRERTAALRPDAIADYDVFDPERVMAYLRDAEEWRLVDALVYRPYFETHPQYQYEPPVLHNRRYDPALNGYRLNAPSAVLRARRRILLVANRFSRVVREWRDALAAHLEAVVLSCGEWQVSAYEPSQVDLVVLFDCTAAFLPACITQFRRAAVPVMYVIVHGRDEEYLGSVDPLARLDLTRCPAVLEAMKVALYFPLPGVAWAPGQRAGAEALMALADHVLLIGVGTERAGAAAGRATEVPFVPNGLADPVGPARLSARMYLGDAQALSPGAIEAVERVLRQTPDGLTWEISVLPQTGWPRAIGGLGDRCRRVETEETPASLAGELPGAWLVVPEEILDRYGPFHRQLMEEDLARNGGALASLAECEGELAGGLSAEALRERVAVVRARAVARGAFFRKDARQLHLANLALSVLLRRTVKARLEAVRLDPRRALVLLNSRYVAGSEMIGLLLAAALARVGFDARPCIPRADDATEGDHDDQGQIARWLDRHGAPPAAEAAYGMTERCYLVPEADARDRADRLREWLDGEGVGMLICVGFIPEAFIAPAEGRLVWLGLMQPWGYLLDRMTFIRDRTTGVFTDSRWAVDEWARWLPPPVAWVPSIVETEHFSMSAASTAGRVSIAVGGTIQPRKRQVDALLAVASLLREGLDVDVNIYGYELAELAEYVGEAKRVAGQAPLLGRVRFHGFVDAGQVARDNQIILSAAADEGIPLTLLFGMASGLVPVACPAGGIPEVVKDGETGFLARGFAVDDIAEALRRALARRLRWPEMIAGGRALLIAEHGEQIAVHRLLKVMLHGAEIAVSPGQRLFRTSGAGGGSAPGTAWPQARFGDGLEEARVIGQGPAGRLVAAAEMGRGAVRYSLLAERDNLSGLCVRVETFHTAPQGTMTVALLRARSKRVIREVRVDLASIIAADRINVEFEPVRNSRGRRFEVLVSAELRAGRCALPERWPPNARWPHAAAQAMEEKLRRWASLRVRRRYPAFVPLYGDPS
jgi:glycosyltransferase involved in cell wall biosynthesis